MIVCPIRKCLVWDGLLKPVYALECIHTINSIQFSLARNICQCGGIWFTLFRYCSRPGLQRPPTTCTTSIESRVICVLLQVLAAPPGRPPRRRPGKQGLHPSTQPPGRFSWVSRPPTALQLLEEPTHLIES